MYLCRIFIRPIEASFTIIHNLLLLEPNISNVFRGRCNPVPRFKHLTQFAPVNNLGAFSLFGLVDSLHDLTPTVEAGKKVLVLCERVVLGGKV